MVVIVAKMKKKFVHIAELDGLRGFAALCVAFHHLVATSIKPAAWQHPIQWIYSVSVYGAFGVDIFFVLSGFLITSLLLLDRDRPYYFHNFYWKRALRILPLYLIVLGLLAWILPDSRPYVIISLLFVTNFANVFHVTSSGPFWTLAIEEQFYLCWPQLVRRLPPVRLYRVALFLCFIEPLLRLGAITVHHHNFWLTPFRCDGLAMGAVLACQNHLFKLQEDDVVAARWWKSTGRWAASLGSIIVVACVIGANFASVELITEALFLSGIALLSYGCIAYAITHPRSTVLAVFRNPIMVFFGDISYCFYISHLYIIRMYDHWRGSLQPGDVAALVIRAGTVISVTVILCIFSRYAIERPAQSLRRYVLR